MADVQSNIKVSIDTTDALASIKNLQRQISAFHTSMAKGGAAANAVTSQLQQNLINSVNATGKFSAQMRTIKTTTESFTSSLEKNKFSMGEYFRYAGGASKTFGRLFKTEFETINKVARENVKDLQTQYIKMGRDANGAMKAIAVRPLSLDMNNLATKTMVAAQKQAILNQLLKQGSTNLLNFGKNTQWAGRQLMVGFTIPLMALGAAASKTFMDMETQAIRFKKVYGDLFTSTTESTAALDAIKNLGKEFTKYGIAVSDTVGLASEAAAAGFKGVDLQRQTTAATRLSILGQVESQKALETTIALQNAFAMSSEDLAKNIDFLNAVENQTVLSLDDMSTAIPKAAPVIQQLGGDIKDLAFFMAAMKEGGINASEGANALKSGLASMINPTGKASAMLEGFGINIKKIVVDNKGDLKKTVTDFATALNQLDPLNRAQAIEQMFGKFQFARLSTLFANVTKEGTQAARVLDLAGASVQELAALSEKELGQTSESAMNKFKSSVEQLKLALVPVGEQFLKVITPIAEFITKILDKFNSLGDGTKKVIVVLTAVVAGLGPVLLMTFGLLMNGLANIIKGFTFLKSIFNKAGRETGTLGNEVKYMTTEQRNAAAVASSLDQVHRKLAQTFSSEAAAVDGLTRAYYRAVAAQSQFMPIRVPLQRGAVKKRAKGKPARVGGTGNQDTELALLMPGETVIPTAMSKKYGGLINGMIADNIPGYMSGKSLAFAHASMPFAPGSAQYAEGIKIAGLDVLAKEFPEMIKVVSNLVAEIPQEINVAMKKGVDALTFKNDYNSRSNKFLSSATLGGLDPSNKQDVAALQEIENKIGNRAVLLAEKAAENIDKTNNLKKGTTAIKVSDDLFAKATREVIDEQIKLKGATGRAAKALDAASKQIGQVRVSASQEGLRRGLASGKFKRTRTGRQTQNQIMFNDVNVGRESSSNPNTFYSGNPITPKGSYRSTNKRSVAFIQAEAIQDAATYDETIEKNTKDIYVKSRKRKSPHRLVPQDGRDDARAYTRAVDRELTRASKTRGVAYRAQGAAPIGPVVPSGTSLLPIIAAPRIAAGAPTEPESTQEPQKNIGLSPGRLTSLNNGLNSLTFGLTAASGAGTMFGGKIGELSNQIFKYSGLMFGLMQITQLLTQAQVLQLAANRAATAGMLVQNINTKAFSLTPGLFSGGIKKLLPNLLRFGGMIARFAGPIGAVIALTQLTHTLIKMTLAARERERLAIEGLGDAALLTKTQIKNLGDFFGTATTVSPFLSETPQAKGTAEEKSKIKALRESDTFKTDYKNTIASLKTATDEEAAIIFDSLSVQLSGSGFAKENIETIINALREESQKTSVDFEFKNIDLTTDKGIKNLQQRLDSVSNKLSDSLADPLAKQTEYYFENQTNRLKTVEVFSDSLKKNLHLAGKVFTGFIDGISGQLANGTINANQFNQAFGMISAKISAMPAPQAMMVVGKIIQELPEDVRGAVEGLDNFDDMLLIIQARSVGITGNLLGIIEAMDLIANPNADVSDKVFAGIRIQKFKDLIEATTKSYDEFFASKKTNEYIEDPIAEKGLSDLSKKVIEALKKEIKLLEDKQKALQGVNDELDRQQEFQEKQQQLDADMAQAKISGNYIQAALLGQQKLYNKSQYDRKTAELDLERQIQAIQDRIDALENGAKVTDLEKKLAKAESGVSSAIKKKTSGTSSGTSATSGTSSGTSTTSGTSNETVTPPVTAQKSADAARAAAKAKAAAEAKAAADKERVDNPQGKVNLAKLAADAQKETSNIIYDFGIPYHHFQVGTQSYFVTQAPARKYYKGWFLSTGGFDRDGAAVKFNTGGKVQGFEPGGNVRGPGTRTSDSIPAYLSNGEYVIKADSVAKYGVNTFDALNAGKFAEGGRVIPSWKKPSSPYNSKNQPTGSPYGRYWGELERLYQGSPIGFDKNGKPIFNNAGKDPWGGVEIPGLPFNGKVGQFSDYWHQLAEQLRKSSGPGMGLDKITPPLVGSGASAWFGGLLGGGGGNLIGYHEGGYVHPHPHDALTNTLIQAPRKGTTAYAKYAYEMAKRGGAAKAAAKLTKLIKTDAGPAYEFLQDGSVGYSRARKYTYEDAGMGSASQVESQILSDLSKTAMRAKIIEMNAKGFHDGGPVHPHPHDALTNTLIQAPRKGTTAYAKYAYEMARNYGGAAKAAAKLTKPIKVSDGPAYSWLGSDGTIGYSRHDKYKYVDAGMGSASEVESQILSDLSKTAMRAKIIEMNRGYANGGAVQGFRTGGLNRLAKSGISSVSKLIGSKLSGSKSAVSASVLTSSQKKQEWMDAMVAAEIARNKARRIQESSSYENIVFPEIMDYSDFAHSQNFMSSLNSVNKVEHIPTGQKGYLKSLKEMTPQEARREVFGSLFARRADLLAPTNTAVKSSVFEPPNDISVFSAALEDLSPGSISERTLYNKLQLNLTRKPDVHDLLPADIYAALNMTSEKSYRDTILSAIGYSDLHGGNLYLNPKTKQAGAIDFGRIGDSEYSMPMFGTDKSFDSIVNKQYQKYVQLPDSERPAYLEGLRRAEATLSSIKDSEIAEMLFQSGYDKTDIILPIYQKYIDNVRRAIAYRLSAKPIQGWDENIAKMPIDEDWFKETVYKQMTDFANGGAVKGFRTGGLNRVVSGFAKKMAFTIPNKINQIKNYLKVRSLIKDGMYHGSQPTGLRGEEYLQGKNILEGAETYDPHYGMGFFGTSSKSEAEMYAAGYNSPNNWSESFGSMNKITKAPFGKYVDFTRGTNSIKWQNYKLYQALGMKKDGYLGNYLTENLGDIMAGQNVTGSIMNRINDGMVPGDMASAKWLAWAKPKGVHTEEYMGSFAPKKPASLLDNLKSKFSLLNKPKKYNTGGHVLGAGTATSDSIPAMLSDGEYVIRASSVKKYGTETFDALNAQRFSEGSPGGVSPIPNLGKLSKKQMFGMGARSGATWQVMEELEKYLSLKHGANKNASGFSKWSRALGRVAFNALQGGVSGVSTSPNPLGALVGTAFGLGEGITGLVKEGSQYGVKGGKYAGVKGFDPKAELDNMSPLNSLASVGLSGLTSGVLGVGFGKLGQLAQAANKKFKLTDKIPEPIKNKVGSISDSLRPKIEQLSQPFGNPFKKKPPVAKTPSLIKSAAKTAAQQTPAFGQELLQAGVWNTLGKIKGINKYNLRKRIPNPYMMEGLKKGFGYSYRTGKSYYDEVVNTQYKRDKFAAEPDPDDLFASTFKGKFYYGSESFGELFGLIAKRANDKVLQPLVMNPIKGGTRLIKGGYESSKNLFSNMKNNLSKDNIDNFLYRYTPFGSIKSLRQANSLVNSPGNKEWSRTFSEIPEEYDPSLRDLFTMPTFHGGALPDTLLNRLKPGEIKQLGNNIMNFDLFTTVDKTKALDYAVGKNSEEAAVALQQTIWNKPKSLSKIWDMRGGRKSLWSQNKKGYAALEDYYINVIGHSKATARKLLIGERVPGTAMTRGGRDRVSMYTSLNLNEAFSKMGKKGPQWVIDTIAHAGGAIQGGPQHSVLTTLDPEKRIKEIISILPKDILKIALTPDYIGGNYEQTMTLALERFIRQYQKYGKIFPLLGEGQLTPSHLPETKPSTLLATGGLITQRGLINQKAISSRYNLPSFATGIDYLPNDMVAQLHQGERVLTKEENKTYSSSAPTTNIININGSDLNKKEIAQAVMVELDRAKNKNNKTNMVGR